MSSRQKAVTWLAVALGVSFVVVTRASAQEFYKDKNVSIIVRASPGGGWDMYARLAARHMGKYIPGNPSIIVQNMPGAGGMISVNHVYNRARRDGTVIGQFPTDYVFSQLVGDPAVKFDTRQFNWIGAFARRTSTCVARTDTAFQKLQDVIGSKEPMFVGAVGRGDGTGIEPLLLNELLGTNFRITHGFRGTSDIRAAMERGELDGLCGWGWESIQATGMELLEKGRIRILVQIADQRHPDIPKDVPLITELVPKKDGALLNTYLITRVVGWNLMLPPGVPQERIETLRRAFERTMEDKAFLAEAERARLSIDPIRGEEMARMFRQLFEEATPAIVERIKKIVF